MLREPATACERVSRHSGSLPIDVCQCANSLEVVPQTPHIGVNLTVGCEYATRTSFPITYGSGAWHGGGDLGSLVI